MDDTSEQMASWFDDDELGECPACGERKVIPAPARVGLVILRRLRRCHDTGAELAPSRRATNRLVERLRLSPHPAAERGRVHDDDSASAELDRPSRGLLA